MKFGDNRGHGYSGFGSVPVDLLERLLAPTERAGMDLKAIVIITYSTPAAYKVFPVFKRDSLHTDETKNTYKDLQVGFKDPQHVPTVRIHLTKIQGTRLVITQECSYEEFLAIPRK